MNSIKEWQIRVRRLGEPEYEAAEIQQNSRDPERHEEIDVIVKGKHLRAKVESYSRSGHLFNVKAVELPTTEIEGFLLDRAPDRVIWVKHRRSGHVLCFVISDDGTGLTDTYPKVVPERESWTDIHDLVPSARCAAYEFLKALREVRDIRGA